MKVFLLVLFYATSCAAVLQAHAETGPDSCRTIASDSARLACFDGFFPAPAGDVLPPAHDDAEFARAVEEELVLGDVGPSPVEARRDEEFDLVDQRFSITPHHPNYLLPATINTRSDYSGYGPFEQAFSDWEVKFQLSLKALLAENLWRDSSIWVGYTQQSYWQLYAEDEASAPFRETNYQPEVFWSVPVDFKVLGWNARLASFGFNHQSNGRSEPLSRSWNRITGELVLDRGRFAASIKSWVRLEEDEEEDNNPDIEDYMGRMQLGLAYKRGEQVFSMALKNNLRSENRSGLELNWTFPLVQNLKGFVQLYSGYGENMIDAENYNNRIGIGFALTDWL